MRFGLRVTRNGCNRFPQLQLLKLVFLLHLVHPPQGHSLKGIYPHVANCSTAVTRVASPLQIAVDSCGNTSCCTSSK
jgi:hypothetical protein